MRVFGTAISTRWFGSLAVLAMSGGLALVLGPACGSTTSDYATTVEAGGGDNDGSVGTGDGASLFGDTGIGGCTGLACQVSSCAGTTTSVSGTVFAPNGTLPLYNAVVYVPNAPLDDIPEGASCDHCGNVSGSPIASTLSDTSGNFTLKNIPDGVNIPLVVQIGKWRRVVTLPKVEKCVDNPVDKDLTRLPKNQKEGHIPKIAVTTGGCDHLACLLPKLGLDASEYTPASGTGRLNLFQGAEDQNVPAPAPSGTPPATSLWASVDSLKKYDMVVMSCECQTHDETKSDDAKRAFYDYAKLGGRIFTSHYHYTWFKNSPLTELQNVAEWVGDNAADGGLERPFLVDRTFPKGQALSEWLVNVAASTTMGEIPINQPRADVGGVTASTTTRWVYNHPFDGTPETTKYLSFNAPLDATSDNQCGKVVFGDLHITGQDHTTLPDDNFPASCPQVLTPEEKALIFLFFDLASCVQKESDPPSPPK